MKPFINSKIFLLLLTTLLTTLLKIITNSDLFAMPGDNISTTFRGAIFSPIPPIFQEDKNGVNQVLLILNLCDKKKIVSPKEFCSCLKRTLENLNFSALKEEEIEDFRQNFIDKTNSFFIKSWIFDLLNFHSLLHWAPIRNRDLREDPICIDYNKLARKTLEGSENVINEPLGFFLDTLQRVQIDNQIKTITDKGTVAVTSGTSAEKKDSNILIDRDILFDALYETTLDSLSDFIRSYFYTLSTDIKTSDSKIAKMEAAYRQILSMNDNIIELSEKLITDNHVILTATIFYDSIYKKDELWTKMVFQAQSDFSNERVFSEKNLFSRGNLKNILRYLIENNVPLKDTAQGIKKNIDELMHKDAHKLLTTLCEKIQKQLGRMGNNLTDYIDDPKLFGRYRDIQIKSKRLYSSGEKYLLKIKIDQFFCYNYAKGTQSNKIAVSAELHRIFDKYIGGQNTLPIKIENYSDIARQYYNDPLVKRRFIQEMEIAKKNMADASSIAANAAAAAASTASTATTGAPNTTNTGNTRYSTLRDALLKEIESNEDDKK
ncbi:MAG: hypothetical protein HQK53_08770 [Oligoflexia bacterium]|nr:hypothetical protein [Oligoflexia bacterium]